MKTITLNDATKYFNLTVANVAAMPARGLMGHIVQASWLPGEPCLCARHNIFLGLISRKLITAGFDWRSASAIIREIEGRIQTYDGGAEQLYKQSARFTRTLKAQGFFEDRSTFYNGPAPDSEDGIAIDFGELWEKAGKAIAEKGKERPEKPPEPKEKERKLVTKTNIISKDSSGYIPWPSNFGS